VIAVAGTDGQQRIETCVAALDLLNVPASAGRPSCAGALREKGYGFGNKVISEAVRIRKVRSPVPV
jgi:hypothetical protein